MLRTDITAALVSRLVASQFPEWSRLPVRAVDVSGWENVTFRLGEEMSVRLPSAVDYVPGVRKEQRWLPVLAGQLPLPIPELLAVGGPPPGQHNFQRGGPLDVYDGETQASLVSLRGHIDTELAAEVWRAALDATWQGRPVWFHGDFQPGNLLAKDGRLSAVIDFGTCGVGDPACDTTIAWTFLSGEGSRVFAELLPVDRATWVRGRGWALWKAMKILVGALADDPEDAACTSRVIGKILADHLAAA